MSNIIVKEATFVSINKVVCNCVYNDIEFKFEFVINECNEFEDISVNILNDDMKNIYNNDYELRNDIYNVIKDIIYDLGADTIDDSFYKSLKVCDINIFKNVDSNFLINININNIFNIQKYRDDNEYELIFNDIASEYSVSIQRLLINSIYINDIVEYFGLDECVSLECFQDRGAFVYEYEENKLKIV